ncbi:hypothetical protein HYH03_017885 [Edaphochlamys debaryana]|uniref:Methyltransferase FkbM domain-containing protein n=1 Tax=Edaphochlamys debaryana TaxID=47281 RepID=A0A835XFQ4_9CHLO|nr:hypothetical protein HYH03_017885 [Edaphochlamys debaryana]|eukprot:KAG2483228.1 hypothetical protein HYH03_017885 [Edaphochlamys debaryana]
MSGYFDKSPWSGDSSKLLMQKTPQYTQGMTSSEALLIGVLTLNDPNGPQLEYVTNTTAWNHQQGTMLQWLGWSSNLIVYNARTGPGSFRGVIFDTETRKEVATLPMPVYSMDAMGTIATSLSFARLYIARRDYGYVVDSEATSREVSRKCPDDDGIWLLEGLQGAVQGKPVKPRLLLTVKQAFQAVAALPEFDPVTKQPYGTKSHLWNFTAVEHNCLHWINHAQLNREGTKILFLYRVGHCAHFRGWATIPMTVDIASGAVWRLPLAFGSHHDYGWSDELISCDISGYYFAKPARYNVRLGKPAEVAAGGDGHCSFPPTSNEFLLSDTYPTKSAHFPMPTRTLFTWDLVRNRTSIIGHYAPVKEGPNGISRVDLHPRWSRDGRYVSFDSTHEGLGRQVYLAKVYNRALMRPGVDGAPTRAPRKYYMDLGGRSGDSIVKFLKEKPDARDYSFHSFECNPENMPIIRANMDKLAEAYGMKSEQMVLVESAAWITDGTLSFHMDTRPVGADGQPGKTGGSLFDSPHAKGTLVTVPAMDFAAYLDRTVTYIDHVVCKIDIEGAEYEVLVHLFRTGSIVLCDVLYVEWHGRFRPEWAGWETRFETLMDRLDVPVIRIA